MNAEPTPYHPPQQKRSRESLERLLDAAEEQMAAVGIESFTIADVVRQAELSVGAFYARFPDKKSLLHAVQNRFYNRVEPLLHARMRERASGAANLAEAVDILLDTLIRHITGNRELSRAFMMHSVFDPVMRARGERINKERREVFSSVLLEHRDEIGHEDPKLAIDVAYGLYAALVRGTLVFGQQHELYIDVSNKTVEDELKRALILYLRGEAPPAAKSST
jgi:AcrR family transcriptional regulator